MRIDVNGIETLGIRTMPNSTRRCEQNACHPHRGSTSRNIHGDRFVKALVSTIALACLVTFTAPALATEAAPQPLTRAGCDTAGMKWDEQANVCSGEMAADQEKGADQGKEGDGENAPDQGKDMDGQGNEMHGHGKGHHGRGKGHHGHDKGHHGHGKGHHHHGKGHDDQGKGHHDHKFKWPWQNEKRV